MEHMRRYILTDWTGAPCGLSTLKVRKFRRFRCVKIFCNPIHCPLEDGQTCCFGWPKPNKLCFHIRLVFCSFHIQRAVLVEELGLDCFGCTWSCRHVKCWLFQQAWLADELFVKPMRFWSKSWVETWMNTEQLPFVFFATQSFPTSRRFNCSLLWSLTFLTTKGSTSAASCKSNYLCFYIGK